MRGRLFAVTFVNSLSKICYLGCPNVLIKKKILMDGKEKSSAFTDLQQYQITLSWITKYRTELSKIMFDPITCDTV